MSTSALSLQNISFYGILDTGYVAPEDWGSKCQALIEGGAGIIQLRAKKESHQERKALLEQILPLFEGLELPLIINDDLELAAAYPDLGLHVGQDDISPREAREQLGPDRIIGLSTHSLLIQQVIAIEPPLPFFCIGGINRDSLAKVRAVGAKGVVAVSDVLQDADTVNAVRQFV